jgi:hypothetical protein
MRGSLKGRKLLRWRQHPIQTRLKKVNQGVRGWDLLLDGKCLGTVSPVRGGFAGPPTGDKGWYWVVASPNLGIPLANTLSNPVSSSEIAKEECKAYVVQHLKRNQIGG